MPERREVGVDQLPEAWVEMPDSQWSSQPQGRCRAGAAAVVHGALTFAAVHGVVSVCLVRSASRMPEQFVQGSPYPSQFPVTKAPRPVQESWV